MKLELRVLALHNSDNPSFLLLLAFGWGKVPSCISHPWLLSPVYGLTRTGCSDQDPWATYLWCNNRVLTLLMQNTVLILKDQLAPSPRTCRSGDPRGSPGSSTEWGTTSLDTEEEVWGPKIHTCKHKKEKSKVKSNSELKATRRKDGHKTTSYTQHVSRTGAPDGKAASALSF